MEVGSGRDEFRFERYLGVGCVTTIGGFFSGGMIAVLLAKVAGWARGCEPPQGLPACDWHMFMLSGALIGMITLPAGVIWRLRGRRSTGDEPGL
ncbi:MAG TPA: hypothetical protein VMY38_07815 [Gemmatimonadaceae bacterium]|nr:hypothetical protein [Gemmatimonadaceae bacterium]